MKNKSNHLTRLISLLGGSTLLCLSAITHAMMPRPEFVPGQYILELNTQETGPVEAALSWEAQKHRIETELGVQVLRFLPNSSLVVVETTGPQTQSEILARLNQSKLVALAEPNFIYSSHRTPNDPQFEILWGLKNTGQRNSLSIGGLSGVDIDVETAWDIETGSHKVVVGVIDSGIDVDHADLKGNLWVNEAEASGVTGVDDDRNGYVDDIHGYDFANKKSDPTDDNGHGTHVAGTIGATGNDNQGIVGVNWQVSLMALKFLDADGYGSLDAAIEAINYATKMKAHVTNNSWGGASYSKLMLKAITEANKKQILFVGAAGNHSKNNDEFRYYPANFDVPNIVSVAAIDNLGNLAKFSGYGAKKVHIAAPGVDILSSTPQGYKSWSGTSMATPHVAGVAALVLAKNPGLSAQALRQRLLRTASPMRTLKGKVLSEGSVSAYYALLDQVAPPDPNDPQNWTLSQPSDIKTPHPYTEETKLSWEVRIPGAKAISLYFTLFDTEFWYDQVTLYGRYGQAIASISGPLGAHWSPVIPGDYVRISFRSDTRNNGQGFAVSKVGYR